MPKKILVTDDDPAIGDMLREMLEDAGYEVEIQMHGQAVQQKQESFPGLLFLDIRCPESIDGRFSGILRAMSTFRSSSSPPIQIPDRLPGTRAPVI